MGMTADRYREHLQALLPSGAAWPRDTGAVLTATLDALAQELGRVDTRFADLLNEADPRSAYELLADWERSRGLPDPCVTESLTIDQRRTALVGKVTGLGGQSPAYFLSVLEQLGYVSNKWTRLAWHFIASVQSWTAAAATLTTGTTSVTLAATAADPILRRTIKACAGAKYRYVVARFRRLVAGAWEGAVQYTTPAHGEGAGYIKTVAEPAEWSTGAWVTVAWDMHALGTGGTDWLDSFITGLRLDFSSANGSSVEIDWVALSEYPDPDLAITIDEQVDGLPHRWRVNAPATTVTEATCLSPCTTPLRSWGNQSLQCVMNRLKPAHSDLLFSFL
ncbi:MAG: DUF2313 domain-containing protein [Sulfuricaulis sp.]|nr:DUF2313 domain-containing protein [Sulfuricaulis sp.]